MRYLKNFLCVLIAFIFFLNIPYMEKSSWVCKNTGSWKGTKKVLGIMVETQVEKSFVQSWIEQNTNRNYTNNWAATHINSYYLLDIDKRRFANAKPIAYGLINHLFEEAHKKMKHESFQKLINKYLITPLNNKDDFIEKLVSIVHN